MIPADDLRARLCVNDQRSPYYADLAACMDADETMPEPGSPDCACDNCFYGRHRLADELLRFTGEHVDLCSNGTHLYCQTSAPPLTMPLGRYYYYYGGKAP